MSEPTTSGAFGLGPWGTAPFGGSWAADSAFLYGELHCTATAQLTWGKAPPTWDGAPWGSAPWGTIPWGSPGAEPATLSGILRCTATISAAIYIAPVVLWEKVVRKRRAGSSVGILVLPTSAVATYGGGPLGGSSVSTPVLPNSDDFIAPD